jgi:hypothetical protein
VAALLVWKPALAALPVVPLTAVPAATVTTAAALASAATPYLHSPPLKVLRI